MADWQEKRVMQAVYTHSGWLYARRLAGEYWLMSTTLINVERGHAGGCQADSSVSEILSHPR